LNTSNPHALVADDRLSAARRLVLVFYCWLDCLLAALVAAPFGALTQNYANILKNLS
jgi:hypothetical protein